MTAAARSACKLLTSSQDYLILLPQRVIDDGGALGSISFVVLGTYLIGAAVTILLTRGRLGLPPATV